MSDSYDSLRKLIKYLNTSRLGSLGEFIFAQTMQEELGAEVISQHDDRFDFLVDGTCVDVKTSARAIFDIKSELKNYRGRRVTGVEYALVEFFLTGVRISQEETFLAWLKWNRISDLWDEWSIGKMDMQVSNSRKHKKLLLSPIESEIQSLFERQGMIARIIYRTGSKDFGNESPHNLIPTKIINNRVTIYLDFKSPDISRDNLRKVIAIPDKDTDNLPMLARTRLHLPKVDIDALSDRYRFDDIDDLRRNHKRIL